MRLLLFSNSTNVGVDYFNFPIPYIKDFISSSEQDAIFIPFAAVTINYEDYFQMVAKKFLEIGIQLSSIHHSIDPIKSVKKAKLIVVGGGNTFCLLKKLQDLNLLDLIRSAVKNGIPYIGWSAGSNLACPTIKTTNDMHIVEPLDFKALNIIPFQLNPHYTELSIQGHGGETREMRIIEFITINPNTWVVGLREGTLLQFTQNKLYLKGNKSCRIFKHNTPPKEFSPVDDLNFLMQ